MESLSLTAQTPPASASDSPTSRPALGGVLEKKRKEDLADARARLAEAWKAPDSPDKTRKIRKIEEEVGLLENPLEQRVLPASTSKPWQAWEDEPSTSTFHGFLPRHPRPEGIGLGHLGYDAIYIRARDGLGYTSADVPNQEWDLDVNSPIVFESEDGKKFVVDKVLSEDNPCVIEAKKNSKNLRPLYDILVEEEARDAGGAPNQEGI